MKEYLISVVAAAIISAIVMKLLGSKGTQGAVGKLITGLFLAFTIISPLRDVRLEELWTLPDTYLSSAEAAVAEGQAQTNQALKEGIKQGCEAYILDKANQLEVDLEVEVAVTDGDIPTPSSVRLKGNVSPNAKSKLSQIISQDLGIPGEEQTWI